MYTHVFTCILVQIYFYYNTEHLIATQSSIKQVWERAIQVIDHYEEGKLKGQKLNLSSLLSKPEFKQQYSRPSIIRTPIIWTLDYPDSQLSREKFLLALKKIIRQTLSICACALSYTWLRFCAIACTVLGEFIERVR